MKSLPVFLTLLFAAFLFQSGYSMTWNENTSDEELTETNADLYNESEEFNSNYNNFEQNEGQGHGFIKIIFKLCKEDLEKLCKDAPNGMKKFECLVKNVDKLGGKCAVVIKKVVEHHKKMAEMKKVCAADFEKFCKQPSDELFTDNIEEGHECGLKMCIQKHFKEFTPACQKAIKDMHPNHP